MLHDLDLIVREYPKTMDVLRVYAIGDAHVGSPQFDERAIRKKIQIIQDDPNSAVCLCGDLGDFGLKTSKTNAYKATMQPKEQKEFIYEMFLPIADRITAAVPGNHEERLVREVGICPLYDLCVMWGIPEVYRENVAITKYSFGNWLGNNKPITFVGITTHGASRAKHKRFIASFDGIDFAISGHTHTSEYSPHGKVRIDSRSETAAHIPYKEIVVDAHLLPGGYGFKYEFEVPPPPELQYIELTGFREGHERIRRKAMSYHTVQI